MHPHRYMLCAWRKKHTDKIYAWGQTDFRNTSFELTKAAYAHLPKTIVGYILYAYKICLYFTTKLWHSAISGWDITT